MSSSSSPRRHYVRRHPNLLLPPSPPSPPSPPFLPARVDLTAILAILRSVDTVATSVLNEIDNTIEPEHEVRQALKDLRKAVENLKSDIMAYDVLLKGIEYHHVQRYVMGLR